MRMKNFHGEIGGTTRPANAWRKVLSATVSVADEWKLITAAKLW